MALRNFLKQKSTMFSLGCAVFLIVILCGIYNGFLFEYLISDQIINYVESQAHSDYGVLLNEVMKHGNALNIFNETIHFKLVMGASPPKVGTTFIKFCMDNIYKELFGYNYIAEMEVKYWHWCGLPVSSNIVSKFQKDTTQNIDSYKCNLHDYLTTSFETKIKNALSKRKKKAKAKAKDKANNRSSNNNNNNNNNNTDLFIFAEKSPAYFHNYQSCYYLLHNSIEFDPKTIYFYMLLRHPVSRVWSQYWMYLRRKGFNKNNKNNDVNRMIDRITNDINEFDTKYPLLSNIMSLIKQESMKNSDKYNPMGDINRLIADKYMRATFNIYQIFYESYIFSSCYYAPVLMWYHVFHSIADKDTSLTNNGKKKHRLRDRLRIIQSEYAFSHLNQTFFDLTKWIFFEDNDDDKVYVVDNVTLTDVKRVVNDKDSLRLRKNQHSGSFAPEDFDIFDYDVANDLTKFFEPCNQLLYRFVAQHRDLLIGEFVEWK